MVFAEIHSCRITPACAGFHVPVCPFGAGLMVLRLVRPERERLGAGAGHLSGHVDMYNATFNGNRAPLVLGNHFNAWNHNAYSDAIGKFVVANCGKPDTYCVPFRDAIAWMNMQDPAVLAKLQAQSPEIAAG